MKPSERILEKIKQSQRCTPLVLCSAPYLNDAVFEIGKILDEFCEPAGIPSATKATGLFFETVVVRLDELPASARSTFLALLRERYYDNGGRR